MKRILNWILGRVYPLMVYFSDKSAKIHLVTNEQMYHVLRTIADYESDPKKRTDLLIEAEKYVVPKPQIPRIVKIPSPPPLVRPKVVQKLKIPKILGMPASTIIMVLMTIAVCAQVGPPHIELNIPVQEYLNKVTEPIPGEECHFLLTQFDRDPYDPESIVIGQRVAKEGETILCDN